MSRVVHGIVRRSGRIAVVDDEGMRHLHCPFRPVQSCFGEWSATLECGESARSASTSSSTTRNSNSGGGGGSGDSTMDMECEQMMDLGRFELILMPEEAIYLACVVGCLEVSATPDGRELPTGTSLLDSLLMLSSKLIDESVEWDQPAVVANTSSPPSSMPSSFSHEAYAAALTRAVVFRHFLHEGYTVKDGILYGVHFVIYNGSPENVHADYGIWITGLLWKTNTATSAPAGSVDGPLTWLHIQGMTRLLNDVSKELILCSVESCGLAVDGRSAAAGTDASSHRVVEVCLAVGSRTLTG